MFPAETQEKGAVLLTPCPFKPEAKPRKAEPI